MGGYGAVWLRKVRPLYGLLWKFFGFFCPRENFWGKETSLKHTIKTWKKLGIKRFFRPLFPMRGSTASRGFSNGLGMLDFFLTLSHKLILKFSFGMAHPLMFGGCRRLRWSAVASQRISAPGAKAQGTVDQVCEPASSSFLNFCIPGGNLTVMFLVLAII